MSSNVNECKPLPTSCLYRAFTSFWIARCCAKMTRKSTNGCQFRVGWVGWERRASGNGGGEKRPPLGFGLARRVLSSLAAPSTLRYHILRPCRGSPVSVQRHVRSVVSVANPPCDSRLT